MPFFLRKFRKTKYHKKEIMKLHYKYLAQKVISVLLEKSNKRTICLSDTNGGKIKVEFHVIEFKF